MKQLKPIPTPQFLQNSEIGFKSFQPGKPFPVLLVGNQNDRFAYCGAFLATSLIDTFSLNPEVLNKETGERTWHEGIIICNNPALLEKEVENADVLMFANKNAAEQGYVIKCRENAPILILAMSETGCLYGIATLLQLLKKNAGGQSAASREIIMEYSIVRDYPDFRYRGNTWTLGGEIGVWSYDRGDGIAAYKARIIHKLDLMLKHKINLVYLDAFGWDTERFSGYAELLRTMNREARLRGITLVSGGYYMDYACSGLGDVYQGEVFKNRYSYPDGEEYPCIGTWDKDISKGRRFGTCISNNELLQLKVAELKRFVAEVEPGALYLHGCDADSLNLLDWKSRCPACRKRWPDDDLSSQEGAAGAFAYLFSAIIAEINSVKKEGYDAAKDCIKLLVSPGYMAAEGTDQEFEAGTSFWTQISRAMKPKENIVILYRELFFNHNDNNRRFGKLLESLHADGDSPAAGVIYFCGGDGFKSDKLFQATAGFVYMFAGCEMILCPNGNAFQEPLQLCNAEYMWNMANSSFYNLPNKPQNYKNFMEVYDSFVKTEARPEAIYGQGGFLETACCYIYGHAAGVKMADVFRLKGNDYEPPVAYASNVELKCGHFTMIFPMRWDNLLDPETIGSMVKRYEQLYAITGQAKKMMEQILSEETLHEGVTAEIKWYVNCLDIGIRHTGCLFEYMKIYRKLDSLLAPENNSRGSHMEIKQEIESLISAVKNHKAYAFGLGLKPIDLLGGALARRYDLFDFLEYNLGLMYNSAGINQRMPDNRKELPVKSWS